MIKPERLKKGDTVAVIAPASPPSPNFLRKGISYLEEELGLKVKVGQHVYAQYGYLAGEDESRLIDLENAFLDKEVKGIICACGGYGTARLASKINYSIIAQNPKIFWGYSDITFLHTAISNSTGLVTFHGPMLSSDIGKEDCHPLSKDLFQQLFEPKEMLYTEEYSPLEVLVEGKASGRITGGNLSLITSSIGTPFEINTKSNILLIEDINEEPRSVDRMLNQLLQAGKLTDAAGIVIGDFHQCHSKRDKSLALEEVMDHYIQKAGKPAMKGFKIGHCSPQVSIPLGVNAEINTNEKVLMIDSGVE